MLKLLLVVAFLVLLLVGGLAAALNYFFGWKGLLAFPFVLVALVWVGKRGVKAILGRFTQRLFLTKSRALRKATTRVHSIVPAPVPASVEPGDEPVEPKHYYDVDCTITPRTDDLWEPSELGLASQKVTNIHDVSETQVGIADEVLVWKESQFVPDDPGKYPGERRL